MEAHGHQWIGQLAIGGRFSCHAESQRSVVHGHHNYALVHGGVLGNPTQAGFGNVVAVQKLLLRRWLHPNFVLSVRRQEGQRRDVEDEFVSFRKFAKTCAKGYELVFLEAFGKLEDLLRYIINAGVHLSEAVGSIRSINQQLHVRSDTVNQKGLAIKKSKYQVYLLFG